RWASAVSFIFCRMKAETSDGANFLESRPATQASPLSAFTILYGTMPMSFWVIGSSNRRPIRRLIAKNVYSGLVTPCRLAGCPMSRSPSWEKATMEGVVRAPSAFSMTLGAEPSMTATHELVVPRSIPITFAILMFLSQAMASWPSRGTSRSIPLNQSAKQALSATPCQSYGVYRVGISPVQGIARPASFLPLGALGDPVGAMVPAAWPGVMQGNSQRV